MTTFLVEDMTCAHCEATLRKAIAAIAPTAQVRIDLPHHLLQVEAAACDDKRLADVIRDAGYTPAAVPAA